MSENKKCPKCGNMMIRGKIRGYPWRVMKTDDHWIWQSYYKPVPFCCSNCGYIELYNEKNVGRK